MRDNASAITHKEKKISVGGVLSVGRAGTGIQNTKTQTKVRPPSAIASIFGVCICDEPCSEISLKPRSSDTIKTYNMKVDFKSAKTRKQQFFKKCAVRMKAKG